MNLHIKYKRDKRIRCWVLKEPKPKTSGYGLTLFPDQLVVFRQDYVANHGHRTWYPFRLRWWPRSLEWRRIKELGWTYHARCPSTAMNWPGDANA